MNILHIKTAIYRPAINELHAPIAMAIRHQNGSGGTVTQSPARQLHPPGGHGAPDTGGEQALPICAKSVIQTGITESF